MAGRMIAGAETVTLALAFPKPGVLAAIVAEPAATPVTGTFTLVAPVVNVTVPGAVATPVLVELRLAVRPAGAGPDRFNVRFPVEPVVTVRLPGVKKLLPPLETTTVTPAFALGIPAALAVIVTEPTDTPVTGTATLVVLAANVTVAGTVVTLRLLELRLTGKPPAGAGPDRVSVKFPVEPALIVRLPGEKLIVSGPAVPTVTSPLADANPEAEAVTMADPAAMPFTLGGALGIKPPCGMKMFAGDTVTFEGSLLVSVMKTPPAGAGLTKVTGNGAESPGATVVLAGTMMSLRTVTLAVALAMPGALAVIVAEPGPTPVTGTGTLVAPAANVTVGGTLATAVLLELRLTVKPPAAAGPDRFSVRLPIPPTVIDKGDPVKLIVSGA